VLTQVSLIKRITDHAKKNVLLHTGNNVTKKITHHSYSLYFKYAAQTKSHEAAGRYSTVKTTKTGTHAHSMQILFVGIQRQTEICLSPAQAGVYK
jgi:hypothetical protein